MSDRNADDRHEGDSCPVCGEAEGSTKINETMLAALREARVHITNDRDSLFRGVQNLKSGEIDDPRDRAEVNEYDALLRTIDAAIHQATGGGES